MELNLEHFKEKLTAERKQLITELQKIGKMNPNSPEDWDVDGENINVEVAERNEVAEKFTEEFNNNAVIEELEAQLREVEHALKKIDEGGYGVCEISGEPIPIERLEAFPAARSKVEYADQVRRLL